MTRWSRFFVALPALAVTVACGTELDVDADHDHDDYGELTYGRGVRQGVTVAGAWSPPADIRAIGDQQQVDYDGAPPFDGGANCSGGSTPGSRILRDVIVAAYPQVSSIGIYNCRVIAGSNSMSLHGVGRALDIMIPTIGGDANNTAGDAIAHWLIQNAQVLGLQQIIWDHTIWSVSRSPRTRAYSGSNPHVDHLHVEINEAAAFLNLPWYQSPVGPGGPAPACEVVGADGIVDAGPCQQLLGPAQYWRTEAAGHAGQLRWTNAYNGTSPSNQAKTTVKVATPGRYRLEAYLHPTYAKFAQTRYRLQTGGTERTVTVDQGARAPAGGGFVTIADVDIGAELTVIIEDNVDFAPPTDARSIMVDAFRVTAATATPPPEPEPTPETDPTPEPEPEPTPEPTDPEPTPETDPEPPPEPVPGDDDIIDEGDADDVLDGDDPGAAGEVVILVEGGCSQAGAGSALPLAGLALLLVRRRRR